MNRDIREKIGEFGNAVRLTLGGKIVSERLWG